MRLKIALYRNNPSLSAYFLSLDKFTFADISKKFNMRSISYSWTGIWGAGTGSAWDTANNQAVETRKRARHHWGQNKVTRRVVTRRNDIRIGVFLTEPFYFLTNTTILYTNISYPVSQAVFREAAGHIPRNNREGWKRRVWSCQVSWFRMPCQKNNDWIY